MWDNARGKRYQQTKAENIFTQSSTHRLLSTNSQGTDCLVRLGDEIREYINIYWVPIEFLLDRITLLVFLTLLRVQYSAFVHLFLLINIPSQILNEHQLYVSHCPEYEYIIVYTLDLVSVCPQRVYILVGGERQWLSK